MHDSPNLTSGSQWLRIARSLAVLPLFLVLAASVLVTSPAPSAEALDSEEQAFLGIINNYRAQNGLEPLALDPQLNGVARWMADDMAKNDYFSHTDSLGRDPFARMDAMGYTYNTWRGENLVAGTEEAQASFEMWTGSPGHNANMLGANYTVIGIARAYNSGSTFGWYWATEFGGQTAAPPPAAAPEPEPVTLPPVAPAPEPAPVQTVAAAPPPAPTATPEIVTIATENTASGPRWWQVGRILEEVWARHEGGTFVASVHTIAHVVSDPPNGAVLDIR